MGVQFKNFEYCYSRKGKPVFAPSALGRKIGEDIKSQVESAFSFDDFVYHLKKSGGHVAALHTHRQHQFFARVDLANFFYSVGRNRVQRALTEIGIRRARHYAKWSCVKNPCGDPGYALPYGFVQSPILSSLVLMKSNVGNYLRSLDQAGQIAVSMYVDDISISSNDKTCLDDAFALLKETVVEANFLISEGKVREPSVSMDIFNCDLVSGKSLVRQDRKDEFYSEPRSALSVAGFEEYVDRVADGNVP
ncbi:reverse transcriptase domain-containing protein [Novosphingobium sp. BL-8H]|uniref:reverse transcriptase domain-containing protein n=1 Tax=Novosphingobium sp. BL-8H TaxID=3127640 RepID=UPI0037577133